MKIKVNRERVKCLDLRVEALVTARLKEGIDGLVRRVSWIVLIFSGTADRRLSAGHVGAAISHRRRLFSNFQKCPNTTIYSLSSLYICIHKFIDSQTYILCVYILQRPLNLDFGRNWDRTLWATHCRVSPICLNKSAFFFPFKLKNDD